MANVTSFFTLAIASLGVEIGGTASRERNRETTARGGREGENAFSPFSSCEFSFNAPFLISHLSLLCKRPD